MNNSFKTIRTVGFSLALLSLVFIGCKKKTTFEYDNSNTPKIDKTVDNAFDEMTLMSDQAITGTMEYYKMGQVVVLNPGEKPLDSEKAACNVVITVDTLNSVKTVTIDYGPTNCDCNDGKTRRGKVITTLTGSYFAVGTVKTHTTVNYYVNDNKIEGTKTVTNMGPNSLGQPTFNVSVNGTVTLSTGEVVTYTATRVRTMTAGYNTPGVHLDNEFDITGSASATISTGGGYTSVITTPLHKKIGCGKFVSGTINFTPTNKPLRIIDYGNGACDETFTVTINGVTYTIN